MSGYLRHPDLWPWKVPSHVRISLPLRFPTPEGIRLAAYIGSTALARAPKVW